MCITESRNSGGSDEPRVCMFSQRHVQRLVSRCADYEFEDVVCELDDVELLLPEPLYFFAVSEKFTNQFARYLSTAPFNPGLKKLHLGKSYDLFIAKFMFLRDLPSINSIVGWKDRCRSSVCWISEAWVGELHKWKAHLKILSQFDYILLSCNSSVGPIQKIIRRPCFYMAPGIDTIRFCPYPNPPVRSIDVYSLGRKSLVTHKSLLEMAEQKQIFYIYDTIKNLETLHHRQHRSLMANIAKRCRYFVVNPAKIDEPLETHGQSEIGYRFLEGAAAGTVLIGESPRNETFRKNFDWPDAVIEVPFHSPNIAEVLADLDSQPGRLEKIRKNNIIQSLLRHDWVYRWGQILDMVDLEPKPALLDREKRLKKLAQVAKKN